jgi:hypothetical protein
MDPDPGGPKTCGSGSGRPKNMRVCIPKRLDDKKIPVMIVNKNSTNAVDITNEGVQQNFLSSNGLRV